MTGRVISLHVRTEKHGAPVPVAEVVGRVGGGLEGDIHAHRSSRAVLVIDPGAGNGYCLSPRELQIARLVASGATNRAIADALEISLWTVSTHLRRVFAKTGVASRAEMVAELFGGLHVPLED